MKYNSEIGLNTNEDELVTYALSLRIILNN